MSEVVDTRPKRTVQDLLAEAHPRPWDWEWQGTSQNGAGHFYLKDANGRRIGVIWGKVSEREAACDLILMLVNEAGGERSA